MSTNRQFREIAAELRGMADRLTHAVTEEDTVTLQIRRPGINLTIRCAGDRNAVLAVAEKYERGAPPWVARRTTAPAAIRKPRSPAARTVLDFTKDGELDNAREYLRQWPEARWPARAVEALAHASA